MPWLDQLESVVSYNGEISSVGHPSPLRRELGRIATGYSRALSDGEIALLWESHSPLIVRYSFDEGTAAAEDPTMDGEIKGGKTLTVGRDGSVALAFDGLDDYVEFPAAVTADILGSNPRTVCLWAAIGAWDFGTIFSFGSALDGEEFCLAARRELANS